MDFHKKSYFVLFWFFPRPWIGKMLRPFSNTGISIREMGAKKIMPDSFQRWPVIGQEEMPIN